MRYWMRHAVLTIGQNRYSMDDLEFSFETTSDSDSKLPICNLEIQNLSPSNRAALKKGDAVAISAGYKGDIGLIFAGGVASFSHEVGDLNIVTKMTVADNLDAWTGISVNKPYKGPILASSILEDLLSIFGAEVGSAALANDLEYKRGRVCKGKLKDVLTTIARECGSRVTLRTGQLLIAPLGDGAYTGYLLTPESGLLKSKQTKQKADEEDPALQRECLLNYRLGAGDRIIIRDAELDGEFVVRSITHKGSSTGDWKSIIEVMAV